MGAHDVLDCALVSRLGCLHHFGRELAVPGRRADQRVELRAAGAVVVVQPSRELTVHVSRPRVAGGQEGGGADCVPVSHTSLDGACGPPGSGGSHQQSPKEVVWVRVQRAAT